ncbi:uncharacterized protein LOC112565386 [Pomacea canaliculata]|uniref:uncharacterized protein LOC112565386 n=1 Tax=Pomacea canaliculata TaxID=400727 RepID=UPI000D73D1A6|nr:uncharacterized protein LOC112565386 [Pomacea canaliculata]
MSVFVLKLLTFYAIFLMYGPRQGVETSCCPGDKAETGGRAACNQTSSLVRKKDWIMDLNITAFISNVLLVTTAENDDSVQVDIGTTSCDTFDDKACYITCSNLTVDRKSACYVTINVTCNVDNVEGRYVRIRKSNTTEEFALCHAIVAGWPSNGQGLKNYALNASASQSSTYHSSYPSLAVDGEWGLSPSSNSSCSQTVMLDSNNTRTVHWWQVILTKPILVSSIIIVNIWNKCCSDRLANFTVELGSLESNGSITYTLCRYHDGVAGPLTTLNCMRSIWGQSVPHIQDGG